jgi:ureidoglycolate dehydrogenase (NAD+)
VGNPIVATALAAGGKLDEPFLNGVAIAIDLSAFGDVDAIRADADRLGEAVANLPAAEGVDRVLLPGERGAGILRARERDGIPLPRGTWRRLLAAAVSLGVEPPVVP